MRESSTSPTDELTPTVLQEVHDHGELFRKKLFQVGGALGGWAALAQAGVYEGETARVETRAGFLELAWASWVGGFLLLDSMQLGGLSKNYSLTPYARPHTIEWFAFVCQSGRLHAGRPKEGAHGWLCTYL